MVVNISSDDSYKSAKKRVDNVWHSDTSYYICSLSALQIAFQRQEHGEYAEEEKIEGTQVNE